MSSIIKKFMDKSLSVSYMGERWFNGLIQNIVEAGRTIGYVETLGNKADKLHLSIKNSDERKFIHEFEQIVRFSIAKLGLKKKHVKIAFDVTEDLTWCENNHNLRASVYKHQLKSWQYLSVSIVDPEFIPLMSFSYSMIKDLDSLVIDLLKFVETLDIKVDLVLFDRGFYHAHLIDYLNGHRRGWSWPYLMLVPANKKVKKYTEQTKSFGVFEHEFYYKKDQSGWRIKTKIIVRRIDENVCWCYATNKKPSLNLVKEYSKRWNIETGFRIHDETNIKSKSKSLLVRFFYHLIGMLLILLWKLQNTVRFYVFKKFLKFVEYQFYSDEVKQVMPPP